MKDVPCLKNWFDDVIVRTLLILVLAQKVCLALFFQIYLQKDNFLFDFLRA